jgi:hypothetical protein
MNNLNLSSFHPYLLVITVLFTPFFAFFHIAKFLVILSFFPNTTTYKSFLDHRFWWSFFVEVSHA